MKKIYFLALALVAFTFGNAQSIMEDDMEFYTLGEMGTQNPTYWTSWTNDGGAANDGFSVSDDQANSGTKSLVALGDEGRDPVLLLGNETSGVYSIRWQMYIPAGKEGYFNMQGEIPALGTPLAGVWNSGNIYFNEADGNPGGVTDTGSDMSNLSFAHDAWFDVTLNVDVDALTYSLTIGANTSPDTPFATDSTMGGLNFYPGSGAISEFYVDDAQYWLGDILGTNDFSENQFSVYPNPVQDVLNIQSTLTVDTVTVYDILGKVVINVQPDAVSPSINMAELSSGAYLVQVSINGTTSTVKVIK
jgi:hypothetical protein